VLLYVLSRDVWGWTKVRAGALTLFLLTFDIAFFGANILKIPQGGWFPLLLAAVALALLSTWKRGREVLVQRLRERSIPLSLLVADLAADPPQRVPGTAVFLTGAPDAPPALVHNLIHNKVLHEQVVLLTVVTEEVPHVPPADRVAIESLPAGFHRVTVRYGFMEQPNVPDALVACQARGLNLRFPTTTFFLGRETLITTDRPGLAAWRKRLFSVMSRNALSANAFFRIPPDQIFEVGAQVEL
jgi:KUP system potassium uptake protein